MEEIIIKKCKLCGKKFIPVFGKTQFLCGRTCGGKWSAKYRIKDGLYWRKKYEKEGGNEQLR